MSEDDWKELKIRRDLAAMQKNLEIARRSTLQACLDAWRPYVLRRCPMRPNESREVIQDQVYGQILLEPIAGRVAA